ncbi:MAG: hypothetical protein AAF628_03740 [Planctomycetota bacterium]
MGQRLASSTGWIAATVSVLLGGCSCSDGGGSQNPDPPGRVEFLELDAPVARASAAPRVPISVAVGNSTGSGSGEVEVVLSGRYWFDATQAGRPMTFVQTTDPQSATRLRLDPGEVRVIFPVWDVLADEGLGRAPTGAAVQRIELTATATPTGNGSPWTLVSERRVDSTSRAMPPLPLDTLPFVSFREPLSFLSRDPATGAIESRSVERVWSSSESSNETRDVFFSFFGSITQETRLGLDQQFKADPFDPLPAHQDFGTDGIQAVIPTDFNPERPDCLATPRGALTYVEWDPDTGSPVVEQSFGAVHALPGAKTPGAPAAFFQLGEDPVSALRGWLYWVYAYDAGSGELNVALTLMSARGADALTRGANVDRTLLTGLSQEPAAPQLVAAHMKGDGQTFQLVFGVRTASGLEKLRLVEVSDGGTQGLLVSAVADLPDPVAIAGESVRGWHLRPWDDGTSGRTSLLLVREVADQQAPMVTKPIKWIQSDLLEFDVGAGAWAWRALPDWRFDITTAPLPGASASQRHLGLHAVHTDDLDAGLGHPGSDLTLVTNDTKFSVWVLSGGAGMTPEWRRALHIEFETVALRKTQFLDINGDQLLDFVTQDLNKQWEYYSSSLSGVAGSITALAGSGDRPELFDLNDDDLWDLIAGTELFLQEETGFVRSRKSETLAMVAAAVQPTKALVEQVFLEEGRIHLVLWGSRKGTVIPVGLSPADPEGFFIEGERAVEFAEVATGVLLEVWPWTKTAIQGAPAAKDLIGITDAGELWHWAAAGESFEPPQRADPGSLDPRAGLALVRRGELPPDADRVRNVLPQDVIGARRDGRGVVVFAAPDLEPSEFPVRLTSDERIVKVAAASLTEDRTDDLVLLIERNSPAGVTYRLCAYEQQPSAAAGQLNPEPFFASAKERALWKVFAGPDAQVDGFGFDYRVTSDSEGFFLYESPSQERPNGVFFRRRLDGVDGTSFVRSPIVSRKGAAFNFVMTDTDRDGQAEVIATDDQMAVGVVDRGSRSEP